MRVVLDTNILISAFLWKGKLAQIFNFINQREIILCFSKLTLDKLIRVSRYPHINKKIKEENLDFDKIVAELASASIIVNPKNIPDIIKDDPSDNIFLACALSAQASFIISGDKHLLNLKEFQDIPILTPHKFLNRFQKM